MKFTPEEIGAKMDALGLWGKMERYNFAVRPRGTVFPYFCTVITDAGVPVRFLMLEGWQTMHDYVRTRIDRNFGYYMTPSEMPHLELVKLANGEFRLFRHDPCYVPLLAEGAQRELAAKILWEAYGVMLRVEADGMLPLRFVGEKAIFARVETEEGKWEDTPLEIPNPRPYSEKITLSKEDIRKAKDLPMEAGYILELDFRLHTMLKTNEKRPRNAYCLTGVEAKTGKVVIDMRVSANPEYGIKGMWQEMPSQVLKALVEGGKMPGEIRLCSGRVFRMLRALCVEVPIKLTLLDKLSF